MCVGGRRGRRPVFPCPPFLPRGRGRPLVAKPTAPHRHPAVALLPNPSSDHLPQTPHRPCPSLEASVSRDLRDWGLGTWDSVSSPPGCGSEGFAAGFQSASFLSSHCPCELWSGRWPDGPHEEMETDRGQVTRPSPKVTSRPLRPSPVPSARLHPAPLISAAALAAGDAPTTHLADPKTEAQRG